MLIFLTVEPLSLLVLLDCPHGDIVFLYKDKYIRTFVVITGKSTIAQNNKIEGNSYST